MKVSLKNSLVFISNHTSLVKECLQNINILSVEKYILKQFSNLIFCLFYQKVACLDCTKAKQISDIPTSTANHYKFDYKGSIRKSTNRIIHTKLNLGKITVEES